MLSRNLVWVFLAKERYNDMVGRILIVDDAMFLRGVYGYRIIFSSG